MKYLQYNILPFLFLISLMIIIPSGHQFEKGILIIIILIQFFLKISITYTLDINRKIFYLFILFLILGIFYGIFGLLRNNPGALITTKEIVFYPFLFFIFINQVTNIKTWELVNKTILISSFLLSTYIIATIANTFGILPDWLYFSLETENTNLDVNSNSLESYGRLYASFSSLPILMFLQPYLFTYALLNKNTKKITWVTIILISLIMCLTGRRILLIVAIFFPIFIFFYLKKGLKFTNTKFLNKKRIFFIISSIIFLLWYIILKLNINLSSIWEHFLFSFQFEQLTPDGTYVENIRIETFKHLMTGWLKSPIFGYGSGAYDPNFIRNAAEPWNYEITYVYLLYSFGLFGFIIYCYGIYYIIKSCLSIYKSNTFFSIYAIASMMGMVAFLFGTSTNPYLLKLDSLIIIFIPIMIINLYKINRNL